MIIDELKPLDDPRSWGVGSVSYDMDAKSQSYVERRQEDFGDDSLHPWKLRLVDGEWEVYGTGATIETRWDGTDLGCAGLDTPLTLTPSVDNFIYARATVTYGVVGSFAIDVESAALDRVVAAGGEQTELNILIGVINDTTATQRLRDPVNLALTCVAGVPAWVPLLSEGVVP